MALCEFGCMFSFTETINSYTDFTHKITLNLVGIDQLILLLNSGTMKILYIYKTKLVYFIVF